MNKVLQVTDIFEKVQNSGLYSIKNHIGIRKAFWDIQKENYSNKLLGFMPDKTKTIINISEFIYKISPFFEEIIVFAFDAISFDYYLSEIEKKGSGYNLFSSVLSSTFPSTSTTAWTSMISGVSPSRHGVYGTSFYLEEFDKSYNWILNALADKENFNSLWKTKQDPHLNLSNKKTIFERLEKDGFKSFYLDSHGKNNPFPLLGIMDGSKHIPYLKNDFDTLKRRPLNLLSYFLDKTSILLKEEHYKKLIWNYIDVDDFIHENGYIELSRHDIWKKLFDFWSENKSSKRLFLFISDHGQTEQVNSGTNILKTSIFNNDLKYNAAGAGRTMFFYPKKGRVDKVKDWLENMIGDSGFILTKKDLFKYGLIDQNCIASTRIGELITLATKPNFPSAGFKYVSEHGSLHSGEMFVPFILQIG